jgi:hypothetical protein
MAVLKIDKQALEEGKPIPVLPETEFRVTRFIVIPHLDANGHYVKRRYERRPADIYVLAFTGGEACARADEIQANTHAKLWHPIGEYPWSSRSGSWHEVPPTSNERYELR